MNKKHILLPIIHIVIHITYILPLLIITISTHYYHMPGYHTTNVVTMNKKHMLLVWGGLHNRAATTKLELFDIDENIWMEGK